MPPRCLDCGYVLEGLNVGRCPECNRPFDPAVPSTYTIKPPFLLWRFWLPGFALAALGGLAGGAIIILNGGWGWSLWFGVPFAVGSLLGYRVRSDVFMLVLLGLLAILILCLGGAMAQIAGVYCGLTLWIIAIGPMFLGTALGSGLRRIMKRTRFTQRWYLPALALAILPLVCAFIEGRPRPMPRESIQTSMIMPYHPEQCWNAIMFYEEVKHDPPFILNIGLARPLRTIGRSQSLGDIKTCIYNKGRITKQVTNIQHAQTLEFAVIEQNIGYEHDVRLLGGSFAFESLHDGRTRITLTTEYEPLLTPRWCWRPFEKYAVHTLHNHVLEGMSKEAAEAAPGMARAR